MSLALTAARPRYRYRLRRNFGRAATAVLGVVIAFWTLIPVYNMLLIALSEDGDEFTGTIWPSDPNLESFWAIWLESNRYLEGFWHQFGNSIYLGLTTMVLTVLVGSLASFAMGRMRFRKAWMIGNFSLITYAVPASFLVIPFTRLMHVYGLTDNILAVVAAEVAFATPYAILIFHRVRQADPARVGRSGTGGWCIAVAGVPADLPAVDGTCARRGRAPMRCCSPGTSISTSSCCCPRRAA